MIKSNELRLGNLIEHEIFGVVEVVAIYKHGIDVSKDGKTKEWFAGSLEKPIPLTEDWLKRFGFAKYDTSKNEFVRNSFRVCLSVRNEFVFPDWDYAFITIQYVHQLQNLYFALTQTELTPSNGGKIE